MNVEQLYEQTIKPLSNREKLFLARRIMAEIEAGNPHPGTGFDYLKRILPQIERIRLTDEDLSSVVLDKPLPG